MVRVKAMFNGGLMIFNFQTRQDAIAFITNIAKEAEGLKYSDNDGHPIVINTRNLCWAAIEE